MREEEKQKQKNRIEWSCEYVSFDNCIFVWFSVNNYYWKFPVQIMCKNKNWIEKNEFKLYVWMFIVCDFLYFEFLL